MSDEEYEKLKQYMADQIKEIELYKDIGITKGINNYNKYYSQALDPVKNKLKLFSEKKAIKDWIEKHAAEFRERWEKEHKSYK